MKLCAPKPARTQSPGTLVHFNRQLVKQKLYILILALLVATNNYGQSINDSIYKSWWANKSKSYFQTVDHGIFLGVADGYIQLKSGKDTVVLHFRTTKTILSVKHDPEEMYDKSTKQYSTQTNIGMATLSYEIYALANILTINLKGSSYSIGSIDGASDLPIRGLNFNYCSIKGKEFLTLFVTKPLELTNAMEIMKLKNINYLEAQKLATTILILPGSTLIFTINK